MPGGYQTQVTNQEAIGVPGDLATSNPRATLDVGPGGLVADTGGVTVGNFAWVIPPTDPNGTNQIATQARGSGNVAGFCENSTQALNTVFLSDGTLVIPEGLPVTLFTQGDFIVTNSSASVEAQVGMKAYATFGTGAVTFAAAGSPSTSAEATSSTIAAETNSWTGSIANDVMTVTAVGGNTLYAGTTITGVGVAPGTMIAAQITPLLVGEVANGVGRYLLTVSQQKNIASEAMTGTYGVLTVGTLVGTALFQVGQLLENSTQQGSGAVVANTTITQLLTGTGGTGSTLVVNNNTAVGTPQTIYTMGNVETWFKAASAGGPGQAVKITSWVSQTYGL